MIATLALVISGSVFAQDQQQPATTDGQTTMKIEEAADKKNKVDGDVDQEITNAKLRAESGSKSRYSLSFTANYNGGSLAEPMSKDRANPTNDPIAPKTNLSGDFGGRYRIDKNQSISATLGYALERPFHEAERGQISNPSLSYNNSRKIGLIQNVASASVTVSTNSDEVEVGTLGYVAISDTMVYDFGGSRMSIGVVPEIIASSYNKKNELVQPKGQEEAPALAFQEDYSAAIYPFAEYAFNDTFNIRTVFRPWIFSHARAETDFWTFSRRPWTQSLGIGIAMTRDVFLYPNFQWDWERWRRDDFNFARERTRETSTVGMSAVVNVF